MDAHLSYDDQKKLAFKGLKVLGIITIVEVLIALLAKGHLVSGIEFTGPSHYIYMAAMICFSLYKAYYIVYFFMHMAHELPGLRWSILLPLVLIVWAIIAFLHEGNAWGEYNERIEKKNKEKVESSPSTGSLNYDENTTKMLI